MTPTHPDDIGLTTNPLWFKEAIIYELHVRAFADSNGDGIGDFAGLVERLDYLQDLGVTALWLLPFYPSPLRDGGYDISDFTGINPSYGTLADFERFLDQAHRRGIRVITELVLNHTSSEHAWFQRARRSPPGSSEREFYVWSDSPNRYRDARIIFTDFESSNWTWDPVAGAYYWHRFYWHQPDLNYDHPAVHEAVFKTVDHWLDLGVDGLRLDAVPYLYEREGTNCENLPETHSLLKKLRAHIDSKYKDRMLLAEANQWPADAAAYFGQGDECHMNFHFPLMPRMFMAIRREDSFPIVDILAQTPTIPETCQWATFLRNHDELTLEMVTDEDRDYMYRVYAEDPTARINLGIRRRLAPLLKSRRKIELMNGLLFSLPGTPVLYYGDELGMGDNIYLGDRDGVRTPMQWSADRNAGFSRANPQQLYLPVITDYEYHYESLNVEVLQRNASSLLWWMKRVIGMRKRYPVFGRGDIEFLQPTNHRVLAFLRRHAGEAALVVANLSRYTQHCELDLSAYLGLEPVEMFGRTPFPAIEDRPYFLAIGPHSFYWFELKAPETTVVRTNIQWPTLAEAPTFAALCQRKEALANALFAYVPERRWFRGKARQRRAATIEGQIALPIASGDASLVLLRIDYVEGEPETYLLALAFASGDAATTLRQTRPDAIIAHATLAGAAGVLYDAFSTGEAAAALLQFLRRRNAIAGPSGQLHPLCEAGFQAAIDQTAEPLEIKVPELEQSNSTLVVDDRLIVKIYRQIEQGPNPEYEIGMYLNRMSERLAPPLLGAIEYRAQGRKASTLATVQEFVPNRGNAWDLTLSALARYYERVLTLSPEVGPEAPPRGLLQRTQSAAPGQMQELIGTYLGDARRLGERTAGLHLALGAEKADPAFVPEPCTLLHQQSIYQWARTLLHRTVRLLRERKRSLSESVRELADRALLGREKELDERFRAVTTHKLEVHRIRCHGDLHLGQVLHLGDDFLIIDFEGEPAKPLVERRYKRVGLRDATGMLRSFSYAAESALRSGLVRPEDQARLAPWAQAWVGWIGAVYLGAYLSGLAGSGLLPASERDTEVLLDFYHLEKCIYEVGYELNNRPAWIEIPLLGLAEILDGRAGAAGDLDSPG